MDAYIYCAALLCERCARDVLLRIQAEQVAADPNAETLGEQRNGSTATLCAIVNRNAGLAVGLATDSDRIPDGPHDDGGGAADSPQHCGDCGRFLENDLTDDGERYVKRAMADAVEQGRITGTLHQWAQFYGLRFDDAPRAVLLDDAARFRDFLLLAGACKPAREWAAGKTLRQAWAECPEPDWLAWWLEQAGVDYVNLTGLQTADDIRREFPDPVSCKFVEPAPAGGCECADPGCPVCAGRCCRPSATLLQRVDMADETGTAVCYGCAEDAMASGLFVDVRGTAPAPSPADVLARIAKRLSFSASPDPDDDSGRRFTFTMASAGHRHSGTYTGPRCPDAADVLGCMLLDADGIDSASDWIEWAEDFGMLASGRGADVRKARDSYRECRRERRFLLSILGAEHYRAAVEAARGL